MNATIASNLIAIDSLTIHNGRGFMTIDAPNGWDDVKKLTKKILKYEGKLYRFTAWNSDRNKAYFRETTEVAQIVK